MNGVVCVLSVGHGLEGTPKCPAAQVRMQCAPSARLSALLSTLCALRSSKLQCRFPGGSHVHRTPIKMEQAEALRRP